MNGVPVPAPSVGLSSAVGELAPEELLDELVSRRLLMAYEPGGMVGALARTPGAGPATAPMPGMPRSDEAVISRGG